MTEAIFRVRRIDEDNFEFFVGVSGGVHYPDGNSDDGETGIIQNLFLPIDSISEVRLSTEADHFVLESFTLTDPIKCNLLWQFGKFIARIGSITGC